MPALNFQRRFAPKVESGEKRQTIRLPRKRPFACDDRLYLYTGMRTRSCRKLGESICTGALGIIITAYSVDIEFTGCPPNLDAFAQADGFDDFCDFRDWFNANHGLPFRGDIIWWGDLERGAL